jgi:23S rRNA pseudouridine1911/1915/1917 synthase
MLNRAGGILINGRRDKAGYRIRGGEIIEVDVEKNESPPLTAEQIPLQIVYEDSDLAVIDKPAGLVVHPGSGSRTGTLVHGLLFHFQNLSTSGGSERPGIVHRLDKNTSGLLVIAKNNTAHARLSKAFQERQVQKSYVGLVHGKIPQDGRIDLPVGRHPTERTKMAAGKRTGRTAYTEYHVLERFGAFSLLRINIKTGRTHQIRVHLSAIGHPVVGDNVYGPRSFKELTKKFGPLNRHFLHACELRFAHPATGALLEFQSPLPAELQKFLISLKS